MKDHQTTSHQCKNGDHEHCGYIWLGTKDKHNVCRWICTCECKHRPQRAAKLYLRQHMRINA